MANLTKNEIAVLLAWPLNYADAESNIADNATWNEANDIAKATGLPIKTVKGVLGSLAKKGLVEGGHDKANGVPGDLQVLTEAGIRAVFDLKATPVETQPEVVQVNLDGDPQPDDASFDGTMPAGYATRKEAVAASKLDPMATGDVKKGEDGRWTYEVAERDLADDIRAVFKAAEGGVCAAIRAAVKAFPTAPKADFVVALKPLGVNPITIGVQRGKALRGA